MPIDYQVLSAGILNHPFSALLFSGDRLSPSSNTCSLASLNSCEAMVAPMMNVNTSNHHFIKMRNINATRATVYVKRYSNSMAVLL